MLFVLDDYGSNMRRGKKYHQNPLLLLVIRTDIFIPKNHYYLLYLVKYIIQL